MTNTPHETRWVTEQVRSIASIGTGAKDTQDRVAKGRYPFFVRSQKIEQIDSWSYDGEAVLTAGDGVGTGKVFHYINGKFDYHQRVYRISNFRQDVSGKFFFYQFSRNFLARIESLTAKSSVDSVRMEAIAGMAIDIPPRDEQDLIVEAIGDTDDLITTMEKMITKKRAIRQGMMQQLLTGKTRLPGFTAEWASCSIRDLADQHRGAVTPNSQPNLVFQHFSLPAFDSGEMAVLERGSSIDSNKFRVPPGAVLLSKLNPRIPRVWAPSEILRNAVSSTEFIVLIPKGTTNRSFLKWLLKSERVTGRMALLATGTTGSHQRMHPQQVAQLEVDVPSEVNEQSAIAAALDDAEQSIESLRIQLGKARSVRNGMMQELLTGRTRLQHAEVAV